MTEPELRAKCTELAAAGCALSAAVLAVIAQRDRLGSLVGALSERVAAQSALLSRKAGRVADVAQPGESAGD
jgi:hypothetical protein